MLAMFYNRYRKKIEKKWALDAYKKFWKKRATTESATGREQRTADIFQNCLKLQRIHFMHKFHENFSLGVIDRTGLDRGPFWRMAIQSVLEPGVVQKRGFCNFTFVSKKICSRPFRLDLCPVHDVYQRGTSQIPNVHLEIYKHMIILIYEMFWLPVKYFPNSDSKWVDVCRILIVPWSEHFRRSVNICPYIKTQNGK